MSDDFTTTPNYGLYKPTVGADVDIWGNHLNANADILDDIIGRARGGFILVTAYLPVGQPDGVTDNSADIQAAIDAAAGHAPLMFPANAAAYVVGTALELPSNTYLIIEAGATLKIADNANVSCLGMGTVDDPAPSNILIELYGTLDGNSANNTSGGGIVVSQQQALIAAGVPMQNIYVRGNRQGLITNFANWCVNLSAVVNGEVAGVTIDGSGNSVEFTGLNPVAGTSRITSGSYVSATGALTITTATPHGIAVGAYFQAINVNVTVGSPPPSFYLQTYLAAAGTGGTTIQCTTALHGMGDMTFGVGGVVASLSGTYISATGACSITTTVPHGLTAGTIFSLAMPVQGTGVPERMGGQFTATAVTSTTISYTNPVQGLGDTTFLAGRVSTIIPSVNVGFSDCIVRNVNDLGLVMYGGVQKGFIRNCDVSAAHGGGAMIFSDLNQIGQNSDCEIVGCTLWGNNGPGAFVGANAFGILHQDTVIRGNRIFGNNGGGVFLQLADGVLVENNYIHENLYAQNRVPTLAISGEIGIQPSASRVTIIGNVIYNPCVGRDLVTGQPAYGIAFDTANYLYISGNRIGDFKTPPTMVAALGGSWGQYGLSSGNYYGPRINTVGNFPADVSVYHLSSVQGVSYDLTAGYISGFNQRDQISGNTNFPATGLTVGWNYSGGLGEVDFLVGSGGSSGGFNFLQVAKVALVSSAYTSGTGLVNLTTNLAHLIPVGGLFNLSSVAGTSTAITGLNGSHAATTGTSATSINFAASPSLDIVSVVGGTITAGSISHIVDGTYNGVGSVTVTTDVPHGVVTGGTFTLSGAIGTSAAINGLNGTKTAGAGTAGTSLQFTATPSLDISAITTATINGGPLDGGVIDTSAGNGGVLFSVDGYGNTRLGGALVHGAMQTATLAAGGTVTVNPNTSLVLVQNASSIATGAVVLPAPQGGSYQLGGAGLEIRFQNAVGALTMTAAAGASIAGPPTAVLSGGSSFRFVLTEPGNVWLPCIADVSGTPPVGGPYLPLSGGAVTGPTTFGGTVTATGAIVTAGGAASLPGSAIQALHDALPATGGTITLSPNTVYAVATEIAVTKPNVRIVGPSWGTILRRTIGMTGAVINITGAGCVIENLTVDGNATAYDGVGHSELRMVSANGLIDNVQVLKGGGSIHVTLAGEGACIRNSTITGLALAPPTETNYGVWAVNGNSVKIINNTITGTGIDAIGFDGAGTIVSGNRVYNCHWYVANGGGQIAAYSTATGAIIANNSVGPGGATGAGGIEVDGDNIVITGNEVVGPQGNGITLTAHASHILVDGNLVKNTGSGGVVFIGISVAAGVSDFQIINNRVFDDQATKTMHWGVSIIGGAGDRFVVQGNVLAPTFTGALADAATGTDKIISDNIGVDDVIGSVASAATVTLPLNSIVSLTGTTGITAFAAAGSWRGRKLTLLPTGVLTITAGATIANTITTTAGVPVQAVFDGTLWHFQTAFADALTATSGLITTYTGTLPTAVPLSLFDIVGSGASNLRQSMTAAGGTPSMIFRSAGGTMGVPTPTPNNQVMGGMAVAGYAPTAGWGTAALGSVQFTAAGLWSDTSQPTFIQFLTTPIGSVTPAEGIRVSPNGNLLVGGSVDGAIKLDVTGTSRFQGVGFYNATPVAVKPTVTGSKGANAALASLLTALAAYGLVTDSST